MISSHSDRISQNLPVPKCSTCGQFVPLEHLGDHICPLPPPRPKLVSTLPLKRLQPQAQPVPSTSQSAFPPRQSRGPSNSPTKVTFQPRPSPLAPESQPTNAGPSREMPSRQGVPPNAAQSATTTARTSPRPIFHPQPVAPPSQPSSLPLQGRSGTPLGYGGHPRGSSLSRSDTPTRLPPGNIPRDTPRSDSPASILQAPRNPTHMNMSPSAPQRTVNFSTEPFVPPPERGINTRIGGAAGMAGVGRRGFAAITRAAMLAGPPGGSLESHQVHRKPNQPKYLDLDAVSLSTETPPLSAGSGYSSYSPGPTSPLPPEFTSQTATRIPSPPDGSLSTPTQPDFLKPATSPDPLANRFPFFEKFKNKMPGNNLASDSAHGAHNNSFISYSSSASSSIVRKNTSNSIDSASLYRSTTSSTTSSRPIIKDVRRPISPIESESEYGGLAYTDSTDGDGGSQRFQSSTSQPTCSPTSSPRRHRPSGSEPSKNSRPQHFHKPSASSLSSLSTGGSHARTNSAAIAQALGLSQTPPSNYAKIGGPGVMGGRNGSISRRNARPDSMEEMEKALEDAKTKIRSKQPSFGSSSQHSHSYRVDTDSTVDSSRKDDDVMGSGGGGPKAHRSNTIRPRATSPEKAVKLPMRALTSPKMDRDKNLDGTGVRKERVAKVKVCLKCQKMINNGRWVSVDGGGVLCERCWKNMYLPKCRRCNLSIEKQAVSSSDGQLKGKYHKECFNCDTCHKPFPDKTFYVYEGKPLCAYHYHEANDSLCARCGDPIEGPCAVSHSGDRYHPAHLTCEHSGYPSCHEMLSEYWEIDGRMLCERHADTDSMRENDEWTKSRRRVTRFIDLAGVGDSEVR